MRNQLAFTVVAATWVVAGCSSEPVRTTTPRAPFARVEVAAEGARLPASCRYVARIEGRDEEPRDGLTYGGALLALRRSASQTGGNYVVIERVAPHDTSLDEPTFAITGRLFACDPADVRPGAEAAISWARGPAFGPHASIESRLALARTPR